MTSYLNEFPRLESDLPEQAAALEALVNEALQLLESGAGLGGTGQTLFENTNCAVTV